MGTILPQNLGEAKVPTSPAPLVSALVIKRISTQLKLYFTFTGQCLKPVCFKFMISGLYVVLGYAFRYANVHKPVEVFLGTLFIKGCFKSEVCSLLENKKLDDKIGLKKNAYKSIQWRRIYISIFQTQTH